MKPAVYDRYGPPDVLRLEDVEQPVPNDDEVLVNLARAHLELESARSAGALGS